MHFSFLAAPIILAGMCVHAGAQSHPVHGGERIEDRVKRVINNPDPRIAALLRTAAARENVTIKSFNWTGNGVGVMTASFTFENKNDFEVKDPTIMCDFTAASGTMVGTTKIQTIYIKLPKKGRATSAKINFGFIHQQAQSASCRVSDVAVLSP